MFKFNKWDKFFVLGVVLTQIFFVVTATFFCDIPLEGFSFFRVTTYEEWGWIIQESKKHENILWIKEISRWIQTLLTLYICSGTLYYYCRTKIQLADLLIPIAWLVLYAPMFYYIKYRAAHYYLHMSVLPLEIFSLNLMSLMERNRLLGCEPD